MGMTRIDADYLRDSIDEALEVKLETVDDFVWVATSLARLAYHDSQNHMKSIQEDANTIALAQVFATLALTKKEDKNG